MTRFGLGVGVLAASLVGCGGEDPPPGPSEANPLDGEESSLLQGLNEHRARNSVEPLSECAALNVSASKHADDMRDESFVSGEGSDGSTARQRACDAGYQPACDSGGLFFEAVGSGGEEGYIMLRNWQDDSTTNQILLDANIVVAGVGRSVGDDGARWALDLGAESHDSCQ